jgi:hypothetical protein
MRSTDCAVVVMPGPRVIVRGIVPSLEPEDDPRSHGSDRVTTRPPMDRRVKPGNDDMPLNARLWLTGQER